MIPARISTTPTMYMAVWALPLLDEYVELELKHADADLRIPGMRTHLDGWPACREDHESLRALVAGE